MNEGTAGRIDVRVLGPCEIEIGGVITPVTAPALRALLLRLVVEPNRSVPVGELATAVWGEELPDGYRRTLQVQLSKLRTAVGADRLLHADEAYRLVLGAGEADVTRFDELIEAGRDALRAQDYDVGVALFRRALELVRGEHGGIHTRSGLVVQEALRLTERTLAANEDLFEAELALGRHRDVVDRLDSFCSAHPLRSRAVGQLMLALHRAGRSAQALRAFQRHREFMAEEVGLDPAPDLISLERSVLANDPAIDWQPPGVSAVPRVEKVPRFLPAELAVGGTAFVGRLAEQARLVQAWESTRRGEGRLVALGGEAGIGKTRLVAEFCQQLAGSSLLLFGRCEPDVDLPYRPFLEALRMAARQLEPHELRATVEGVGRRLVRVVPELATRLPDLAEEPENDPEVDRFWLYDAVATFFVRLADRHPVVVVLEDMHWADMSTARLLQHVERSVPSHRLLLIVVYRSSELHASHPLHDFAELRAAAGGHVSIRLAGLDEHDIRALANRIAPAHTVDPAELHKRTGGNPFFLQEVLRAGAETNDDSAVPPGVSAVVRARIERLGTNAVPILSAAAVVGPVFRIDVLRAIVGGGDDVIDVVDAGLRTELLVEAPDEGAYGFSHALVMDVLLHELSDARSRQLHAKAAQVLESAHHRDSGRRLAELAHHFVVAAPLGYADQAIDYSRQAARHATSVFAFDEAVAHLQRAVDLDVSSPFGGRHGAALRLELGELQTRAGDVNAARRTFFDAAALAEEVQDLDCLTDTAIALMRPIVRVLGRPDPEVEALATRVAGRVGIAPTRRAALLHGALALRLRDGSPERIAATSVATELATQVDDPEAAFVAGLARYWDMFRNSGPRDRASVIDELFEILGEHPSEQKLEARLVRVHALIELGDGDALRREVRQFGHDLDALPLRFYQAVRALLQGLVALIDGRFSEAEQQTFVALDAFGGDELGLQGVATQLFLVRFAQGRLGELEPVMAAAAARSPLVAAFTVAQTVIYSETGRVDEAATALKRVLAGDPPMPVPGDPGRCLTLVMAARVAGVLRDQAAAELIYPMLLKYVNQGVAMSVVATGGSVARYLAAIAPLVGEDPEPLYEKAVAFNQRLGAPHLVAATQLAWAAACRDRGRRSQADQLIAEAAPVAERLGMGGPELDILSGR